MIIDDLEFINFCDQPDSSGFSVIHGGASASTSVNTSTSSGLVSASASANATGDISATFTGTSAALINVSVPRSNIVYVAGYATSYGAAYAVDRYSSIVSDTSTSISTV